MSQSPTPRVFLVVPAYREGAVIGSTVREVLPHCSAVIVVDDGSPDDTAERAHRAGATVLRHVINRGQGAALQTGFSHALAKGADIIVSFDADGQHPAEAIAALTEPIRRGAAEVVLGSRFLGENGQLPPRRRLLLRAAVVFTRITSGLAVTDTHNGLRAFSRKAALGLDLHQDRMAHASEILDQVARSGLPYVEVPTNVRYTPYSLAKGQRDSALFRILWDYFLGRLSG